MEVKKEIFSILNNLSQSKYTMTFYFVNSMKCNV